MKLDFEARAVPSLCTNYLEIKGFEPKINLVTNKQCQSTMAAALNASGFKIPHNIGASY